MYLCIDYIYLNSKCYLLGNANNVSNYRYTHKPQYIIYNVMSNQFYIKHKYIKINVTFECWEKNTEQIKPVSKYIPIFIEYFVLLLDIYLLYFDEKVRANLFRFSI